MSTEPMSSFSTPDPPLTSAEGAGVHAGRRGRGFARTLLAPLASLKLTVVLFAMSIFLIFVSTLAQVDQNMWEVIAQYYRSWFTRIDLQVLFPRSFFPNLQDVPGWFVFPGGFSLGLVLAVNLLFAHLLRFRTQARGRRLAIGGGWILFGAMVTWLIVIPDVINWPLAALGIQRIDLDGTQRIPWSMLFQVIKLGLCGLLLAAIVTLLRLDRSRTTSYWLLLTGTLALGALVVYLLVFGERAELNSSSMRIVWQLLQGALAGGVLLVGMLMVFGRRGGIVLIHTGVGLLMLGELIVGLTAVEEEIQLGEFQTVSFARDTRVVELAIVDSTPDDHDEVVVIPGRLLAKGGMITDRRLPFDVEVVHFYQNSSPPRPASLAKIDNPATAGIGTQYVVQSARSASGAETSQGIDIAAAYLRLIPKGDSKIATGANAPETYLCSQYFGEGAMLPNIREDFAESVPIGNKTFQVSLRFKRNYKNYSVKLLDVRKEDYIGTQTPRSYSSDIELVDTRNQTRRKSHIWMNNPLRYAGETFYQSGYTRDDDGREFTTLQVVTNFGWMIPYVACMLVMVGMLSHFGSTLLRYLDRKERDLHRTSQDNSDPVAASTATPSIASQPPLGLAGVLIPASVVVLCLLWIVGQAVPRPIEVNGMRLDRFAQIPIVYQGRVKPIDTLARNSLRIVSNRQTYRDAEGKKQPAIRWLLDVISLSEEANRHEVFRIDNLDVLNAMGLQRRKGYRYANNEFDQNDESLRKQLEQASEISTNQPELLDTFQRKLLESYRRIRTRDSLLAAFRPVPFPELPTEQQREEDPEGTQARLERISRFMQAIPDFNARLMADTGNPRIAVGRDDDSIWQPYSAAMNAAFVSAVVKNQPPDERIVRWAGMLDAYAEADAKTFNTEVERYLEDLADSPPPNTNLQRIGFEVFFNRFEPFALATVLYLLAFGLTALSWLFGRRMLTRTTFCLILLAFGLHTFALLSRIYISGRPPVTNLYSSAIFVGWGCVVMGIVLESLSRIGIGNLVAAVCGFATLLIAGRLAGDGDTFTVLQAVLDTQFWLATHVTCITLGYAATFLAGVLGIVYILYGVFGRTLASNLHKELTRMIYGVLCFALFFSMIGTVLGGLWADDSWGRFWGWDPKENGALMIVLWNALVLHARWGGMVRSRGLAILAVGGNIITGWSWFGVNELGVGLHSYGFTEGVLLALGIFILSQLCVIVVGLLGRQRQPLH